MWNTILQTADFLKQKITQTPDFAIVLGSGLGGFAQDIQVQVTIPYSEIPNFPISTVEGHKGALLYGTIGNKKVLAMQGRFHYYEGYTMQQVTFPIRVFKQLGIEKLIVSNASGGVNPNFSVGDIMLITDHINFMPEHPLRGTNDNRLGPRFLNMSHAYSPALLQHAQKVAQQLNIPVQQGVYLALQGPTFETLAEYRMVTRVGADCVGMSTVPEVIVARHGGMECFGISVITDMGDEHSIAQVTHQEVLEAAKKAEPKVRELIKQFVMQY